MVQNRKTNQREILLRELTEHPTHPTADELYNKVKLILPRISLATVYRNLERLSQQGLISKISISGRQNRFDAIIKPHNHIFCIQCHRLDNIENNSIYEIILSPQDRKGYSILDYRIEFFGLCPHCYNTK